MTKIPVDYRWPGGDVVGDSPTPLYWITEHNDDGATQYYMVIGTDGVGQHIIAEKCYLHWATRVVDGLRAIA